MKTKILPVTILLALSTILMGCLQTTTSVEQESYGETEGQIFAIVGQTLLTSGVMYAGYLENEEILIFVERGSYQNEVLYAKVEEQRTIFRSNMNLIILEDIKIGKYSSLSAHLKIKNFEEGMYEEGIK